MRLFLVIVVALLFAAGTAVAQTSLQSQTDNKGQQKSYLYQWTDDRGVVHISDSLGNVPKKYRGKALKIEELETKEESAQQQEKAVKPSGAADQDYIDAEIKAEWQDRIRAARQRLANAQRRYQELERKRNEEVAKSGASPIGQLEGRVKAQQMEAEMQQAQKDIDDARNEVENDIPEEARKAGVPPGWLRE